MNVSSEADADKNHMVPAVNETIRAFLTEVKANRKDEAVECTNFMKIPHILAYMNDDNKKLLQSIDEWPRIFIEWNFLSVDKISIREQEYVLAFLMHLCGGRFSKTDPTRVVKHLLDQVHYKQEELTRLLEIHLQNSRGQNVNLVECLIDRPNGATLSSVSAIISKNTPAKLIDILLNRGMKLENEDFILLLKKACLFCNVEIVRRLLLSLNKKLVEGNDLLQSLFSDLPFCYEQIEILDVLLQNGVSVFEATDLFIKNYEGVDNIIETNCKERIICVLCAHEAPIEKLIRCIETTTKRLYYMIPVIFLKRLLEQLDSEILLISKGTADECILAKMNSVFSTTTMHDLTNPFCAPYPEVEHATKLFFKSTMYPNLGIRNKYDEEKMQKKVDKLFGKLRQKIETLAALAQTTDIGRREARRIAESEAKGFEPETKRLKN